MIALHHHTTVLQLVHGPAIDLSNRKGIAIEWNSLNTPKKGNTMLRTPVAGKRVNGQV
ncbi:hypothetical protein D3C78_1920200 [compost metagenome]